MTYVRFGHGGRSLSIGTRGGHGCTSLFGQFLQVLVAFLPHLNPLGDVTDGGVFCKMKSATCSDTATGGRDRQRTMNCIRLNAVDMSTAPGAINRWKRSACQDEPMLICCLLTMTDSFYSCYSKGSGVCAWIRRLADDRRRDRSSIPIAPAD